MRAREPDVRGQVDRDGVRIAFESFGQGDTTIVFPPVDEIVHSRIWKAQVPYLARHFRVITIDPRGNGHSDRPTDPAAYAERDRAEDTVAVMDQLGVQQAVLVAVCTSAWQALICASLHPDRVLGVVAINPWARDRTPPLRDRAEAFAHFREEQQEYVGWGKYNQHYWRKDWPDFARFFFERICNDPHSTKIVEDAVTWALDSTGEVQAAADDGPPYAATVEEAEQMLRSVRCPVLVVKATADLCQPQERFETVARLTGAERLVLEGAGHLPMARYPVVVNHAIREFTERVTATRRPTPRPSPRTPRNRRPRVLYLSSPIGLGHVRRDLAIADALRAERDVEVQWLTQSPVSDFLERRGETVHPASRFLASESGHIEGEAGEHDLHAFQAIRRMDEVLVNNFMVLDDLVAEESFDLWVGDEAWDLDHFLHENPRLKRAPFVWMTDFVGWVPMPDGGEHEAMLAADLNGEMVEHVARHPGLRDRSVFVGDPADVVDRSLGPGLPSTREWTEAHFDFTGYVLGEPPGVDRGRLRRRLGYADGDVVCVVSVGGSGVGTHLLRRVAGAYDEALRRIPALRMVVVTGPRIEPATLDAPPGVEVHGFLPDLDLHHAACDIAVVQGGLSTTMELTASRRPFLYFPLGHHFEQQVHVRHRLDRHRAGRCMDYATATPDVVADALVEELARPLSYRPVPRDGAKRAAQLLVELI